MTEYMNDVLDGIIEKAKMDKVFANSIHETYKAICKKDKPMPKSDTNIYIYTTQNDDGKISYKCSLISKQKVWHKTDGTYQVECVLQSIEKPHYIFHCYEEELIRYDGEKFMRTNTDIYAEEARQLTEGQIYKRFMEIIEGELVHDYGEVASKIRGIIQRCKNTIEIEGK